MIKKTFDNVFDILNISKPNFGLQFLFFSLLFIALVKITTTFAFYYFLSQRSLSIEE